MPIYEYRCRNGHDFEVFQSMSDAPVETCEVCGEPVERVFSPVAVHYKGSGFYTTDYARKGAARSGEGDAPKKGDGEGAKQGEGAKGGSSSDSGSKPDSGSKKSESSSANSTGSG